MKKYLRAFRNLTFLYLALSLPTGASAQECLSGESVETDKATALKFFDHQLDAELEKIKDLLSFASFESQKAKEKIFNLAWNDYANKVETQADCLFTMGAFLDDDKQLIEQRLTTDYTSFEEAFDQIGDMPNELPLDGEAFESYLDFYSGHQAKGGNKFELLVDGPEFRDAVFETIRGAKSFINLAYFGFASDRMGRKIGHELIAKKLGIDAPKLESILFENGWELGQDDNQIKNYFSKNDNIIEIRIVLDFFNTILAPLPFKNHADRLPSDILPTMRRYGIEVVYIPSLFYGNNHFKITSSENQTVVSGGNVMDKVVGWNPEELEWHDIALKFKGSMVNDTNEFFFHKFNKFNFLSSLYPGTKNAKVEERRDYYFPESNNIQDYPSRGRLVTTNQLSIRKSSNQKVLSSVIGGAKNFIFIENVFFSDIWAASLLKKKAKLWGLSELKAENGEDLNTSTCDLEKFEKRGKGILVIIPKHMDQPLVKLANDSMINGLIKSGVDVCKWNSNLDKKNRYKDKTMMHSKVWMVDHEVAYVGSANLAARSQKGDIELGIMISDTQAISDLYERVFKPDAEASEPTQINELNVLLTPVRWFGNYLKLY